MPSKAIYFNTGVPPQTPRRSRIKIIYSIVKFVRLFYPKATFSTLRGSLRPLRRVAARALDCFAVCATTLRASLFGACVRRVPSEPASVASVVIKLFYIFYHGNHRNALRATLRSVLKKPIKTVSPPTSPYSPKSTCPNTSNTHRAVKSPSTSAYKLRPYVAMMLRNIRRLAVIVNTKNLYRPLSNSNSRLELKKPRSRPLGYAHEYPTKHLF